MSFPPRGWAYPPTFTRVSEINIQRGLASNGRNNKWSLRSNLSKYRPARLCWGIGKYDLGVLKCKSAKTFSEGTLPPKSWLRIIKSQLLTYFYNRNAYSRNIKMHANFNMWMIKYFNWRVEGWKNCRDAAAAADWLVCWAVRRGYHPRTATQITNIFPSSYGRAHSHVAQRG